MNPQLNTLHLGTEVFPLSQASLTLRMDDSDGLLVTFGARCESKERGSITYHLALVGEQLVPGKNFAFSAVQSSPWTGSDSPTEHDTWVHIGEFDNATRQSVVQVTLGALTCLHVEGEIDLGYWGEGWVKYEAQLHLDTPAPVRAGLEELHARLSVELPPNTTGAEALIGELERQGLLVLRQDDAASRSSALEFLREEVDAADSVAELAHSIAERFDSVRGIEELFGDDDALEQAVRSAKLGYEF